MQFCSSFSYSARALVGIVHSGTLLYNFFWWFISGPLPRNCLGFGALIELCAKVKLFQLYCCNKARAASAKCALPHSSICMPPTFLMTSIPEGGRIPMACFFLPLARSSLRGFCWSLCCQHYGLEGTSLPAVRIAVFFRTSSRHNIPLTTDEEPPEFTNAILSIPLIFTFRKHFSFISWVFTTGLLRPFSGSKSLTATGGCFSIPAAGSLAT